MPTITLIILAIWLVRLPAQQLRQNWKAARPGYSWEFPQDHWSHPDYRTEWWYFTGHLVDRLQSQRRFGYQFTIFRVGLTTGTLELKSNWTSRQLLMGHAAISDMQTATHIFSEVMYRATPLLAHFWEFPKWQIASSQGPAGTAQRWTLDWNGSAFDFSMADERQGISLQLSTEPLKPLVLQGPSGLSRKASSESAASLYYSFTRLATQGRISIGGAHYQVSGESWMDREFGSNILTESQAGWDWFSLQLADGRDLMLFQLRDRSGNQDYASGTGVGIDGRADYLSASDWSLRETRFWTSPQTGARYPTSWRIRVPKSQLDLLVEAELPNQENRSQLLPAIFYWEGAVAVRRLDGTSVGRGYAELTGYGEGNLLPW